CLSEKSGRKGADSTAGTRARRVDLIGGSVREIAQSETRKPQRSKVRPGTEQHNESKPRHAPSRPRREPFSCLAGGKPQHDRHDTDAERELQQESGPARLEPVNTAPAQQAIEQS